MGTQLKLAARDVVARKEARNEGDVWYLSSPLLLGEPPARLGDLFRRAAADFPNRVFLIERRGDELRRVTYAEALRAAEGVADWLIRSQEVESARVVCLSGNSIDHALLMLGCFFAGVPFVPVSPAYSLMSQDFAKLRAVVEKVQPAVIYVEAMAPFERALNALNTLDTKTKPTLLVGSSEAGALSLASLFKREVGREVREREATITADHVAKILFTSGSTAFPKGVPNTHRMLCSNQQMIAQCWPFLEEQRSSEDEHLTIVDWLPWSHTFGGNHNFNMVLFHAGTMFVDEGKPAPQLLAASLRNLKEVPPTIYFNVPAGFAALVPQLESDAELRSAFFSRLRVIFYAAAALPPDLWDRLVKLAADAGRANVFMTTAWGSTETSPLATSMHFEETSAGNIGLPAPGVTLKLVPNGNKIEIRVKGPNVMTAYFEEPALTKQAFDEEGYYKMGDAVRFARTSTFGESSDGSALPDPSGGLLFDGRVVEDFKLSSGTWVSVTTVRTGVIARAGGLFTDVVVCGHDREELSLLAWPSINAGRSLLGEDDATIDVLCTHEMFRGSARDAIAAWNRDNPGSSTRIARILLLTESPNIDAGEITDKGYTNQRATLERRRAAVASLYTQPFAADVIVI